MKKINLLFSLSLITIMSFAQKTIIVNGGKFGDPTEDVNVMIYDVQNKTSKVIDTIHTSSVQDILIVDSLAYVAAQDSIVLYNIKTESRIAANRFPGVSTKTLAVSGNELLVGNFYGQDSANLYFYNKTNLNYIDSLHDVSQRARSILINGDFAYVTQNGQNNSFQDTLGSILKIDIVNRDITDTIKVTNYTQDIGELILNPNGLGFYSINSVSNTITSVDFATLTATNSSSNQNFRVGNKSQFSIHNDTAFLVMNQGIGAIDLTDLSLVDSLIVDTIVTAFTYDTANATFYVTQTNYFSFTFGKIYDRAGVKTSDLKVGFSPEVIRMYYEPTITSLKEVASFTKSSFQLYPNPTTQYLTVETETNNADKAITIFNQQGQLIRSYSFRDQKKTIELNDLNSGLYLISVRSGREVVTKRIILQ